MNPQSRRRLREMAEELSQTPDGKLKLVCQKQGFFPFCAVLEHSVQNVAQHEDDQFVNGFGALPEKTKDLSLEKGEAFQKAATIVVSIAARLLGTHTLTNVRVGKEEDSGFSFAYPFRFFVWDLSGRESFGAGAERFQVRAEALDKSILDRAPPD